MTALTPIEEKLLSVASAGDLSTIIDIISRLTIKEREAVNSEVYDKVLHHITQCAKDPVEQAYATMMFIRNVGRYTSPAAVSAILSKPVVDHRAEPRLTQAAS